GLPSCLEAMWGWGRVACHGVGCDGKEMGLECSEQWSRRGRHGYMNSGSGFWRRRNKTIKNGMMGREGQAVVGSRICEGAHLHKDCPLNKEVKRVEEVKYGEVGRTYPNNGGNRYRVGPPGYYTRVDNRPTFSERKPSLEELMNKHIEESTKRRNENEEWMKKLQETIDMNIRNQNVALKNLKTQVEQLAKDYQAKVAKETPNSFASIGQCKAIFADNGALKDETFFNETNKLHRVSFISNKNVQVSKKVEDGPSGVLSHQLLLKKLSPGSFTLPCTIDSLNIMLVEMADMSKKTRIGIVENVLVKIDKFLFPSDFVVINMLGDPNETMILGRPFLATIHARINVFHGEILLGIREDRIMFDINRNVHHSTIPVEKGQFGGQKGKTKMVESGTAALRLDSCKPIRMMGNDTCKFWLMYDPNLKECNGGDSVYGLDEQGVLKKWYCYRDNEIRDVKEKEVLVKIGHTNVNKSVRNAVLNEWILDSFYVESNSSGMSNDPYSRDLEECKLVFDNEMAHLANEYELRIGKRGTSWMTYAKNVNKYMGERCARGTTKDLRKKNNGRVILDGDMPLGRANKPRFKGMIWKEMDIAGYYSNGKGEQHRLDSWISEILFYRHYLRRSWVKELRRS
ncbi:reverse transcriptase domain-containing protein, partial [Tanacetum coccineum]